MFSKYSTIVALLLSSLGLVQHVQAQDWNNRATPVILAGTTSVIEGGNLRGFANNDSADHRVLDDTPTRGECENEPGFLYEGLPGHDCDTWVPQNPTNYCRKLTPGWNADSKRVKFFCPIQCKAECAAPTNAPTRGECENEPGFLYEDLPGHDCDTWVPQNPTNNCRKLTPGWNADSKRVKFFCPKQCKEKCFTDENKAQNTAEQLP